MFRSNRGYTEERFYPGVIGTVDFNKKYTLRFKSFLKDLGAVQGDKYYIHEFSEYINRKWAEFDKLNGRYKYAPILEETQEQFDEFLKDHFELKKPDCTNSPATSTLDRNI